MARKALLLVISIACYAAVVRLASTALDRPAPVAPPRPHWSDALLAELQRAFEEARTTEERRDIYIRAVDEGPAHHRRGSISAIDRIFGFVPRRGPNVSTIADHPWQRQEARQRRTSGYGPLRVVDLGPQRADPQEHWYLLAADHDRSVVVSEISNCSPSTRFDVDASRRVTAPQPVDKIAELREAYRTGNRFAVALRAIDEGILGRGTSIDVVEEIFGSRCFVAREHCLVDFMPAVAGSWALYLSLAGDEYPRRVACYSFSRYHVKG
jgi:hypothetical protein